MFHRSHPACITTSGDKPKIWSLPQQGALPGAPGSCTGLGAGTGSFLSFHLPVWQEFHRSCASHLLTHHLHTPAHMKWAQHFHHKHHHAFPMPESRLLLEPEGGHYSVSRPELCHVLVLPVFSAGSFGGPNSPNSGNFYLI